MVNKITRRELLKLILLQFPIAYFSMRKNCFTYVFQEVNGSSDIVSKIPADRLPVIEYHYPGYKDCNVTLTSGMFKEQIKFICESKYKTLNENQYIMFIKGQGFTPANSIVLRINQGSAHFEEFTEMIGFLKAKGMHTLVFLSAGEQFTDRNWDDLVRWYKEGNISVGSHSYSHTDFTKISPASALEEAILSKKYIEEKFQQRGASLNITGFAFPSDQVPKDVDYLKDAGYLYAFGGNIRGSPRNNAVWEGEFVAPSLYPYVSHQTLTKLENNSSNNPRSIPLTSGYTFDKIIYFSSTPITVEKIENLTQKKYPELIIGNFYTPLPIPPEDNSLIRPAGIIIHTDAQTLGTYSNWVTKRTFEGLLSRQTNVHFACGYDGVRQFLPIYKDLITPSRGAPGFSNYIQIEMCGSKYEAILSGQINNKEIKNTVELIIAITTNLVLALINQYKIPTYLILGHHQACASGKVDPGDISIDYLKYKVRQGFNKIQRMDNYQDFTKPQ
jgi:hypothetical protein